jgi:translation elongation factor P/translation initiation factor 5A
MPKISVNKLKKNDVIVHGGQEHRVTSIHYDKDAKRVNVFGTNNFAESIPEGSKINIK